MADIIRNTWIEKSSELTVKAAESLIRLFAERSSKDYRPSYTNSYIGLRLEEKPCNFFVIIPQKKALKLSVKVGQTSDNTNCLKQVAAKDIDYTNGCYKVSIEPEADCNDVIKVLLQAEAEFKGAPSINENEVCEAQKGETSIMYTSKEAIEKKPEMDIEELLESLLFKRFDLEEKCNEINQQFVEALRQYIEATGNNTFSMQMDEEKAKEYLMDEYGYDEDGVEDLYYCEEVNYSDDTEYYYPKNESLMNFYITSLIDDCGVPLEYKYARSIAEFAIDEQFDDKVAVKRYFDDDGTEHESEHEGFLLANPNIPETYLQVKAMIELIKQHF